MDCSVSVVLDNSNRVYFPGQQITGTVKLRLSEQSKIKGILIKFCGYSRVCFYRQSLQYNNFETYYKDRFLIYGDGETYSTLFSGEHCFNFQYVLPSTTPSSFEAALGHVRHSCKAVVKRESLQDITSTLPFSVINVVDLNQIPRSSTEISESSTKSFCCLWCASGPISLSVYLQKTGYVSGEVILVNAKCHNQSNRVISSSKASVVQMVTFRAKTRITKVETIVCEEERDEIPPGGSSLWSNVPLVIPPVPPSNIAGCSIIDIDYFFVYKITPVGMYTDFEIKEPIMIGSVPLVDAFSSFIGGSSHETTYTGPVYGSNMSLNRFPALQKYSELPAPSYVESSLTKQPFCGQDSDDSDDEFGNWKPCFATYQMGATGPSMLHM